ncbi:hypothetical protein [Burkholderia sp. LMG 13014]|uniref:hypothetical protein n=1 Tax=Burkholderia sp. LMG 13014 TaxID=2709306 RepID=UPI0019669FA1|nr:hypothetical protein [Burkholderia sp. LMG 13014]
MSKTNLINTITLEPWEHEYTKAKKKEIAGNRSYYDAPGKVVEKFVQWQLNEINLKRVDTSDYDKMMMDLAKKYKEKQEQAVANNLKGRSI